MIDLEMKDVRMNSDTAIVTIKESKTNTRGSFAIAKLDCEDEFSPFTTFKRYFSAREKIKETCRFLLKINKHGKCVRQPVGKNTVAGAARIVAEALKLEPVLGYTSHSFRRSSATALVEGGGDLTTLKRHGRWQSAAVAERYIQESDGHQVLVAKRICDGGEISNMEAQPGGSKPRQVTNSSTSEPSVIGLGQNNIFNGAVNININYKNI